MSSTWPSAARRAVGFSTERQGELGQRHTEHIPKTDAPEWPEWAKKQRALEVGEEELK